MLNLTVLSICIDKRSRQLRSELTIQLWQNSRVPSQRAVSHPSWWARPRRGTGRCSWSVTGGGRQMPTAGLEVWIRDGRRRRGRRVGGGAETEGRFLKSGTEGWQVEDLSRQPGSGVGSGHQRFLVVALLKVQQSFRFSRKLFVLFLLRNGNHYAVCLFFSRKNKVMHF